MTYYAGIKKIEASNREYCPIVIYGHSYLRKMLVALKYIKDGNAFAVETYFMVWQGKIMGPIINCMEAIRVRISCYLQRRKGIERSSVDYALTQAESISIYQYQACQKL